MTTDVLDTIRRELLDDHHAADEEGVKVGIVHAIRVVERWKRDLAREEADDDIRMLLDGLGVATIADLKVLVDHGRDVVRLADDTLRAAGVDPATLEPLRDATLEEIEREPDVVLEAMAAGELGVTDASRHMAQAELDDRRARAGR